MKAVIAGGTGQIGQMLKREYEKRGDQVVILTRHPNQPGEIAWDGETLGEWQKQLEGVDVVINLAGRTVNCRYNQENLNQMLHSRVQSTMVIGEAIKACHNPPPLWLQMSTATLYEHTFDHDNDEETGVIGGNEKDVPDYWAFSIRIAKEWEEALFQSQTPHTRKVALRSAMVMTPDKGGVFMELANLTKKGLGGTIAGGKQYMSWIHEKDFIGALDLIMKNDFQGAINLAAPHPLPQKEFMKIMRDNLGALLGLPVTKGMAEIGAFFLKTDTELVLKSRRVTSKKLKDWGYVFQYPHWQEACQDLSVRSGQYMKKHYMGFALLAYFFTWFWLSMKDVIGGSEIEFEPILAVIFIPLPFMILAVEFVQPFFQRKIFGHTNKLKTMIWSHLSALASVYVFSLFLASFFAAMEIYNYVSREHYDNILRILYSFLGFIPLYGIVLGLPATLIFATWMGIDAYSKNIEAYQR